MSEVMVRNSTRRELEANYQDYDLDHLVWAVERLLNLFDGQRDKKITARLQVESLENDIDNMSNRLDIKDEEIETLKGLVSGLKDRLESPS